MMVWEVIQKASLTEAPHDVLTDVSFHTPLRPPPQSGLHTLSTSMPLPMKNAKLSHKLSEVSLI